MIRLVLGTRLLAIIACWCQFASVVSFQPSRLSTGKKTLELNREFGLSAAFDPEAEDREAPSGGIMSMKSLQTQLASAFSALDETDQYDAVLTGLCAKILDQKAPVEGDDPPPTLDDPIQLVQEMNSRRIRASPRSMMAFIDVSINS